MVRIQKLGLLSVLLLVATFANAQELAYRLIDGTTNQLEVYNVNNTYFSGDVVIPSEAKYNGQTYPVKGIAPNAFANSSGLISISIPSSVNTIGEGAFSGCENLKIARFATIKDLCGMAFAKGNSNPLYLSKHLYIGDSEYEVTTLDIPDNIETINNYAFAGGENITNIYLPKNLKSIGNDVFVGCKGFVVYYYDFNQILDIEYGTGSSNPMSLAKSVDLENGKLSDEIRIESNVKDRTFQGAKWLKTLYIESSVTSIGQYAFVDCVNMTSVSLPESLTSIGEGAFQHCSSLKEVTISGAIGIEIAKNAFRNCSSLEKATVNAPLATLPEGLFRDCTKLNTVNLPKATQTIGVRTFNNTSLTSLPLPEEGGKGLITIGEYAFAYCKIQSLVIPSTVVTIDKYAFSDCANLSDITISERGETPLTILEYAFSSKDNPYSLPNLEHIYSYAQKAPSAKSNSFISQKDIQLVCPEEASGYDDTPWSGFSKSTIKPHTVKYFVDDFLYDETPDLYAGDKIPSVDDPVKKDWDFKRWIEDIPELMPNKDLEIHGYFTKEHTTTDGVKYLLSSGLQKEAKVIGCSNPTQVTIPASVEFGGDSYIVVGIEARAFKEATTLTAVDLSPATYLTSIGNAVFAGCTDLESVIWSENLTEIKDSMFVECNALSTFEIPATVTAIGNWAFSKSGITAITLPPNIETMGTRVFQSCPYLSNVVFDQGMEVLDQLPDFMFYECKNLAIFPTLPSSITSIGKSAFEKCSGLTSLDLNETALTIISNQAFFGCGALKSISLPATLLSLGSKAFSSCQSVEKITINRLSDLPDPPTKEDDSFSQTVYEGASLYVTDVNMYKSRDTWNLFKKIYPIDPLEISADELEITLDKESYQYEGVAIKPVPIVKRKIEDQEILISADEYTVSYTDSINVGTATLTISDKDGCNYKIVGKAIKTYEITRKPGSLADLIDKSPQPAGDNIRYNDEQQNLIIAGTLKKDITGGFTGTLKYSLDKDKIAFDEAIPQGKDAKDYIVYYMVDGDPNYTASDTLSLKVTINSRTASITNITLKENSYTYDGKAKEPGIESLIISFITNAGSKTIDIVKDEKEYKVSYANNVNATNKDSKAQVVITDSLGGNFTFDSKPTTFEITPAKGKLDALLKQWPVGFDTLCYNGVAQNLIKAGIINDENSKVGKLKYSLDNKTFAYDIPQGTKAQTYTVYYKVEDDPNYTPSDTAHFDVTIQTQDIAISADDIILEKDTFTYDGTAQKPLVTAVKIGETTIPAEEYTVSYTDSINAGTATVTVAAKKGGNYDFESASKTYTILKAAGKLSELLATKPQSAGDNIRYNAEPQNLIKAGTIKKGITGTLKYSTDSVAFDTNIPQGTDAKEYTVYYKVEGDPNYTSSNMDSVKVSILPRTASVSFTLKENSYTYDGKAKEPGIESVSVSFNTSAGSKTINIVEDKKEYKVSYANNVNATSKSSKAQVTITDSIGGNFSFAEVSKTFEIAQAKGKLDSLLTQKPVGFDTLCYNGVDQNLIKEGAIKEEKFNGQLKYSLDNKEFSTVIPQGTKAQTYTIYYKVEDDPNYIVSDTLSLNVAIKAKEYVISAENITLEKDSFIYDGTAKKPGVTVKVDKTTIPAEEYIVSYKDSINAGTATVTITEKAGGNYKIGSVSKKYTISPKAGTLEELLATKPQPASDNIIYNTALQNLIKAGTIKKGISGTLKYSKDKIAFDTNIPQGKDAKEYMVYYKVEGDPNYTTSDMDSVKVTINPKSTKVYSISLSQNSYVYDGTAKKPAVTSVTVNYNNIVLDPKEYKVSYANNINATDKNSKAQVEITDSVGGNFIIESKTTTFEITPAKGKLDNLLTKKPTGIDNLTYTGEDQNLIQAGKIKEEKFNGRLKYSLDNKEFTTAIPQGTKAQDYTVYYKVEDDPNYTPSDTLSLKVTIKAKKLSLSAENLTLEKDSFTYDGTAKKPGVTINAGGETIPAEEYLVSYTDSINAGTATVTITAKNGSNYSFESVSRKYKITPAVGSLEEFLATKPQSAGDNILYNNSAQNLIKAGTVNKGFSCSLKYSLDKKAFGTDIPQGTDAKEYTVYYKAEGDPNYTSSEMDSLKVSILPRTTSVTNISLKEARYTYDGTAKKPAVESVSVSFNNLLINPKEYTVSYQDSINAGTGKVIITGKKGGNYSFEDAVATFEIAPAKGDLKKLLTLQPTGIDNLSYTGAAQNLVKAGAIKNGISGSLKYSLDNKAFDVAIPQGTAAQDYTVYYKVEDDPNYTPSDTASFKVTIKAKKLSLSAQNISLEKDSYTYDGTAKKPGVTVKAGGETIPAEEYLVSYTDSINAGTATVTITAWRNHPCRRIPCQLYR